MRELMGVSWWQERKLKLAKAGEKEREYTITSIPLMVSGRCLIQLVADRLAHSTGLPAHH